MSVDPDDVTRFAIRELGATDVTYGSAVLPGSMFLIGYLDRNGRGDEMTRGHEDRNNNGGEADISLRPPVPPIPILGVPASGIYAKTTIFDLVLPRVLAGERIGRKEVAVLGHGGLCMKCDVCRYPICPFGK